MPTKKLLAIINPISGTLNKDVIPCKIKEILASDDLLVDIAYTEYAGHATLLAKNAVADNYDIVLAVGGDGTCNEVAKSLINTNTALAILPMGSGNGFARHLGIPIEITSALKALKKSDIVDIDYCSANDIPFFVTCGLGFDAHISKSFAKSKKRGLLTYIRKVIQEYFNYMNEEYYIETSTLRIKERAFIITCGNVSQYGNNAFITPHASVRDGLIDVTLINHVNIFEIIPTTIQLFTKTLKFNHAVKIFSTPKITITRAEAGAMHIDGEAVDMPDKIVIKCHKGGLKVLKPETKNHNKI